MLSPNENEIFNASKLMTEKHCNYFRSLINCMPHHYSSQDTNRMTLLYFCLSGLDILNQLDAYVPDHEKKLIIDWTYEQQIVPSTDDDHVENAGFRGGPFLNPKPLENGHVHPHNFGHLAMTYTALAILTILGDDFSRVNKKMIVRGMRKLQQSNGLQATCKSRNSMYHDMAG